MEAHFDRFRGTERGKSGGVLYEKLENGCNSEERPLSGGGISRLIVEVSGDGRIDCAVNNNLSVYIPRPKN